MTAGRGSFFRGSRLPGSPLTWSRAELCSLGLGLPVTHRGSQWGLGGWGGGWGREGGGKETWTDGYDPREGLLKGRKPSSEYVEKFISLRRAAVHLLTSSFLSSAPNPPPFLSLQPSKPSSDPRQRSPPEPPLGAGGSLAKLAEDEQGRRQDSHHETNT